MVTTRMNTLAAEKKIEMAEDSGEKLGRRLFRLQRFVNTLWEQSNGKGRQCD